MNYIGEHLLPGQIGYFFVLLSLVTSLVASVSFFYANKAAPIDKPGWLRMARVAFALETISVLIIIGSIYYILANHLFEYKYAWQHSDKTLQTQYIFSCLWEGQEGSFLLWSFWHCVLGWIIIWKVKKWEAPVMITVSFVQFCLATMLLGIYIFHAKVGNGPFVLLRNEGILDNAPVFKDAATGLIRKDYLTILRDGSGLNALLQNYWMVIHPPVLFLGFASTIIPFAFAFAGLLNNDHTWTKAVLPWAAFSAAVLGTGIMMGAAWAYESLTFGGYWAWDPVENASLVPWLVLVAGLHTNLVYKSTGYSLKSTYVFYMLAFSLVLYATFLTRSGILGDTSVHAFTGADMNIQLLAYLFVFFVPAVVLFIKRSKSIPTIHKEENTYSREFWMFIGSLVLCLSAIIIIAKTSLPVFNKLFGTNLAQPEDPEFSHNQIQVFIAFILGTLTALTQYLKYKNTAAKAWLKKIILPTIITIIITLAISIFGNINYNKKGIGFLIAIHIAIFAAVYAIVANSSYIWLVLKGKLRVAGASVAHVGFGMVLLGILISSSKKTVLSWNTTGITPLKETNEKGNVAGNPAENITLFKGIKTDMGKYDVTYLKDTFTDEASKKFFKLDFIKKDGTEKFNLMPDIFKNNKGNEGNGANPASKHYFNKDIFVYVTSWMNNSDVEDTAQFTPRKIKVGDTLFYSNGLMILNKVEVNSVNLTEKALPGETTMALDMTVISKTGNRYPAYPGIAIKNNQLRSLPDTVSAQSLILQFNKVADQATGTLEIGVKESNIAQDMITLKVYEFPFINILWLGIAVMVTGLIMSIIQRNKKSVRVINE